MMCSSNGMELTVESANNLDRMELCVNGSDAISVSKSNVIHVERSNDVDGF